MSLKWRFSGGNVAEKKEFAGVKYGKNIGTRGSCMFPDTCESRILMHSVPRPSAGILGAEGFEMSYFIDLKLFR